MKTALTTIALAAVLALTACSVPTEPGAFIETRTVQYYPACGNELLVVDGTTWYPIKRDWTGPIALGPTHGRSAPRVATPGPGDDVGTLWVYEGGFAYYRSESGDMETWLTVREQTYDWVC